MRCRTFTFPRSPPMMTATTCRSPRPSGHVRCGSTSRTTALHGDGAGHIREGGPRRGLRQFAVPGVGDRVTRAAVWYGARDVGVVDGELRATGPGEAAIAVAYCGICGSDLHEYADGPH